MVIQLEIFFADKTLFIQFVIFQHYTLCYHKDDKSYLEGLDVRTDGTIHSSPVVEKKNAKAGRRKKKQSKEAKATIPAQVEKEIRQMKDIFVANISAGQF